MTRIVGKTTTPKTIKRLCTHLSIRRELESLFERDKKDDNSPPVTFHARRRSVYLQRSAALSSSARYSSPQILPFVKCPSDLTSNSFSAHSRFFVGSHQCHPSLVLPATAHQRFPTDVRFLLLFQHEPLPRLSFISWAASLVLKYRCELSGTSKYRFLERRLGERQGLYLLEFGIAL